MIAHTCPKCDGEKKIKSNDVEKSCPTCNGTGVVWEENSPKVGDTFQK